MAWRAGWSFFWRRALWLAALCACVLPVALFTKHLANALYVQILVAAILAIEVFGIHPLIVRALPGIHYRDFRLVVARVDGRMEELSYREALVISLGPSAMLIVCESLALIRGIGVLGLLVVYPAVAWMLTCPWGRCRLEAVETLSPYRPVI